MPGAGRPLGNGAFGTVFELPGGRAAKVTALTTRWNDSVAEGLRSWGSEASFARRCGELGVGPRVHDAYVCTYVGQDAQAGEGTDYYGVVVMDAVPGAVTLEAWRESAAPDDVRAAEALLERRIMALHSAGLAHGDLHAGNVLVVPASPPAGRRAKRPPAPRGVRDVLIVDYGFASSLADMQARDRDDVQRLGAGRMPVGGDPRDAAIMDVLARLVAEGALDLPPA